MYLLVFIYMYIDLFSFSLIFLIWLNKDKQTIVWCLRSLHNPLDDNNSNRTLLEFGQWGFCLPKMLAYMSSQSYHWYGELWLKLCLWYNLTIKCVFVFTLFTSTFSILFFCSFFFLFFLFSRVFGVLRYCLLNSNRKCWLLPWTVYMCTVYGSINFIFYQFFH